MSSNDSVYCWGISRELQYLLGNTSLKKANIIEFIDSNPGKVQRANLSYTSVKSVLPHQFGNETQGSVLIITAVAYSSSIKEIALQLGFRGQYIFLDSPER